MKYFLFLLLKRLHTQSAMNALLRIEENSKLDEPDMGIPTGNSPCFLRVFFCHLINEIPFFC
jgi:hypothetical protein